MRRDVDRLTAQTFDVLIVGGGIYGLTIAYDAAQRGVSVALVERNDFGSGASFNHLRTIHGGLRYLQTLDIGRARESILERRTIARIAADAVRPLSFLLPITPSPTAGRLAMGVGVLIDRLVGWDRNENVDASHRLLPTRVLSRTEALERLPMFRGRQIVGAVEWHDYVAAEADRLTLAWAIAGHRCGANLANYVEATTLLMDGSRAVGIRALDRVSSKAFDIGARLIVNATGGSVDRL